MAERPDGTWAASEVDGIVSRQNGKNGAVEARELFGLTVLGEWIIHTAHLFKTTLESYDRLLALIESHPDTKNCLDGKPFRSPASGYSMRFRNGGRITFIARSRSSGRGLTGDLLVLDEAQDLNDDALGALLPTISARPGSQAWYFGSAPDVGSTVLHRVRKRGRAGSDARQAYVEHSAAPDSDLDDRDAWAQANPALGTRITEEAVEAERAVMSDEMFARERLSISPDIDTFGVLPNWLEVVGPDVQVEKAELFSLDVNPERSAAAIAVAGRPGPTVELVDYRQGTAWVVDRCVELYQRHKRRFVIDRTSPAAVFLPELDRRRVRTIELDGPGITRACQHLFDVVADPDTTLRVRQNSDLDRAVRQAERRFSGDAWRFSRRTATNNADISPLMAVTVAVWQVAQAGRPRMASMTELYERLDAEQTTNEAV